jgi:hypothetical protein
LPHCLIRTARPLAAILAILVVAWTGACGQTVVLCRAPGGHFGVKIVLADDGEDACCDCAGCGSLDTGVSSHPLSLAPGSCGQPCSDTSLTQPYTRSSLRPQVCPPSLAVCIPVMSRPDVSREPVLAQVCGDPALPYRLASVRVSVLLI